LPSTFNQLPSYLQLAPANSKLLKAYFSSLKTIQEQFERFKIQGSFRASLEFKARTGTLKSRLWQNFTADMIPVNGSLGRNE